MRLHVSRTHSRYSLRLVRFYGQRSAAVIYFLVWVVNKCQVPPPVEELSSFLASIIQFCMHPSVAGIQFQSALRILASVINKHAEGKYRLAAAMSVMFLDISAFLNDCITTIACNGIKGPSQPVECRRAAVDIWAWVRCTPSVRPVLPDSTLADDEGVIVSKSRSINAVYRATL